MSDTKGQRRPLRTPLLTSRGHLPISGEAGVEHLLASTQPPVEVERLSQVEVQALSRLQSEGYNGQLDAASGEEDL